MAPDDRTCAVALGGDSVAAILSLAPPDWHPPAKSAGEFSDADLPRLWTALAGEDAPAAYSATWRLRLGGNRTVEYIREHFVATPVDPHETKRIELLIAQLDNDSYEKRQLAVRSLTDLGSAAEAAMRKSLKETTSFEVSRRSSGRFLPHSIIQSNATVAKRCAACGRFASCSGSIRGKPRNIYEYWPPARPLHEKLAMPRRLRNAGRLGRTPQSIISLADRASRAACAVRG